MDPNPTAPPIRVLDYAPPDRTRTLGRKLKYAALLTLVLVLGAATGSAITFALAHVRYVDQTLLYIQPSNGTPAPVWGNTLAKFTSALTSLPVQTSARKKALASITQQQWDQAVISSGLDRQRDIIAISVSSPRADVAGKVATAMTEASRDYVLAAGLSVQILAAGPPLTRRDPRLIAAGGIIGGVLAVLLFIHRTRRRRYA